jgi:RNA polymerase sigma factor (TIGR02999 family)
MGATTYCMTDHARSGEVTRLLQALTLGRPGADGELLSLVYGELKILARSHMAQERRDHTLQPTALVHEACLRLLGGTEPTFHNRAQFFAAAGEAMRRILIDQARQRRTLKRGGGKEPSGIDDAIVWQEPPQALDLLALDEALSRLEQQDARMSSVVKLLFFVGMTVDQAAVALGISRRTVLRDWMSAKAWLGTEMQVDPD